MARVRTSASPSAMSGASAASGGGGRCPSGGIGGCSRPRATASSSPAPRRRSVGSLTPRICESAFWSPGRRRAISTSAASLSTVDAGRSARAGRVLAPSDELARDRADLAVQPVDAGQAGEHRVDLALVGHVLQRAALLPCPAQPAALLQARLQGVGDLQQVQDVLAGVVDLLAAQGPRVPLREARALAQPHAEQLGDERLVAELRAQAGEARRQLRVEDVADLGVPRALQERHVLARGMEHELDRRGRRAPRRAGTGRRRRRAGRSPRRAALRRAGRRPARGRGAPGSGPRP